MYLSYKLKLTTHNIKTYHIIHRVGCKNMKQCLLPEISNSEYKVTVVFKFYQVWHKILQGWGTDSKKYNLWRNQVAFISTAGIDSLEIILVCYHVHVSYCVIIYDQEEISIELLNTWVLFLYFENEM